LLERVRRRYILVKINSDQIPKDRDFQSALLSSIIRLFGEYGASQTDVSLVKYDRKMKYAIVRCSHKALPMVQAAIAAITKIGEHETSAHTILVSGTLKALKRKINAISMSEKE